MDVLNTLVVKILFLNEDLLLKIIIKELHQFLLIDMYTRSMFVWAFPMQSFQEWFCLMILLHGIPKHNTPLPKPLVLGKLMRLIFFMCCHILRLCSPHPWRDTNPDWVQPWAPPFDLSADSTVSITFDKTPQKVPPDLNYPVVLNCFTWLKPKLVHNSLLGFVRVSGIISLNGSDM